MILGCINLIQSYQKKDAAEKHNYKIHGTIKTVIGVITGLFLTFLYCSFDFFSGHMGTTVAIIFCWLIITLCNLVAHVKIGLDEYDKQNGNNTED